MGSTLISLNEFKTYKGITNEKDDALLAQIIKACSEITKNYCGRTFIDYYTTDNIEYFDGTNSDILFLTEMPMISLTSVSVSEDGSTYTDLTLNTDYFIDYRLDAVRSAYSTFIPWSKSSFNSVKIAYKGGYEETPSDIKQAVMDLVEYYRSEEYTPRKAFQGMSVENLGFREGKVPLPAHIKRVFEMYRAVV